MIIRHVTGRHIDRVSLHIWKGNTGKWHTRARLLHLTRMPGTAGHWMHTCFGVLRQAGRKSGAEALRGVFRVVGLHSGALALRALD